MGGEQVRNTLSRFMHSIKGRMILLIITCVFLPLFFVISVLGLALQHISNREIQTMSELMFSQMAAKMEMVMESANFASSSVLQSSDDRRALSAFSDCRDEYEYYQSLYHLMNRMRDINNSSMIALNGEAALSLPDGGRINASGYDRSTEEFIYSDVYSLILENGRFATWDYRAGASVAPEESSSRDLALGRAILNNNGKVLGVLSIRLPADHLWRKLDHSDLLVYNGTMLLLTEDGRIVSSNKEVVNSWVPGSEHIIWDHPPGDVVSGREGAIYYIASNLEISNITMLYTADASVVFASGEAVKQVLWAATLVILLITCGAVIYISSRISSPLVGLMEDTDHIEDGHFSVSIQDYYTEVEELSHRFNRALMRIDHLIDQVRVENELKQKAYYESLQAQINPHFLFNTLNTIKWTASIGGDETVSNLISELGLMLSATYDTQRSIVTIAEELRLLDSYVALMQARYGNTFLYNCHIDETIARFMIPKFSLQPLVENAIIHGVSKIEAGRIDVSATVENVGIRIVVSDNGPGVAPHKLDALLKQKKDQRRKMTGIGLGNVDERISLLYGPDYGLKIDRNVTDGFQIHLFIPQIREGTTDAESTDRGG